MSQIHIRNAVTYAANTNTSKPLQKFNESIARKLEAYRNSGWYHHTFDYARLKGKELIGKDGRKYLNFLTNAYLMLGVSNLSTLN